MSNHSEERSTEKTRQRRPEEIVVVSKAPCSRKPSNGDKAQQLRFEIVSQEMLLRRGHSVGLGKDKVRPALTMEGVGVAGIIECPGIRWKRGGWRSGLARKIYYLIRHINWPEK